MSRSLRAVIVLALLAGCGSGTGTKAPKELDDACAIIDERPKYIRAFKAAERKYGIPVAVQMATIYQESKFKSQARTPVQYTLGVIPVGRQSSAYGYSQALDATWKEYQKLEGGRGAKRDDIFDATDFMGWYMLQSHEDLGISLGDATNQYLAYHDGRTGFARGTYRKKPWLMRIAREVGTRSVMYQSQLQRCGKI